MMNNFKKENIIEELSLKTGFSVNYSKTLVNDLIECIINQIAYSKLNIKNFGNFKVVKKKDRVGRNPKTNKTYSISARNSLKFTSSKNLKDYLNDY